MRTRTTWICRWWNVTGSTSAMGQRNDIDLDNKYIVLDTSGMPDDLLLPGIFWATDVANDLIMEAGATCPLSLPMSCGAWWEPIPTPRQR